MGVCSTRCQSFRESLKPKFSMPYWRLSAIYFAYFAIVGAFAPYWSLYLKSLGLSAAKIGILASVPLLLRLLIPNFWGHMADMSGRRVRLLRIGAVGACLFFSPLVFVHDFYFIAASIALYSFFWNAIMGQVETITLHCLKQEYAKYGRVRLWGSLGFVAAVLILGAYFDYFEISRLPFLIEVMLLALLLIVFLLPPNADLGHKSRKKYAEFAVLLRSREVLVFFAATFLLHASHGAYYVFYSIYLESAGYGKLEIGGLWTVGVLAEILLFLLMHRLLARSSLAVLFALSLMLTTLRWLGIALFVEQPILLVLLQVLHAFSFGVCHAVAIEFCRRRFSDGLLSRGQAFYSSVSFGAGSAFGALVSGFVWDFSSTYTFILAGMMAFVGFGLIVALVFPRRGENYSCL